MGSIPHVFTEGGGVDFKVEGPLVHGFIIMFFFIYVFVCLSVCLILCFLGEVGC